MARVRGFASRLAGVSIDDLMPLFVLIAMNHDAYSGLLARFAGGEPAVLQANIADLEKLMLEEDSRRLAMGLSTPTSMPSANRAKDGASTGTSTPGPSSNPHRPAPRNTTTNEPLDYPPDRGVPWKIIKSIV